jgi:hypothetical protein
MGRYKGSGSREKAEELAGVKEEVNFYEKVKDITHSGNMQGPCREHAVAIQGTFTGHSGAIQGTFRERLDDPSFHPSLSHVQSHLGTPNDLCMICFHL